MDAASHSDLSHHGPHIEVHIVACPKCGHELHYTRRTVSISCCECGSVYKFELDPKRVVKH